MAGYTDQTLARGEVVLVQGRVALRRYWLNFLFAGLFAAVAIAEFFVALRGSASASAGMGMALATLFLGAILIGPPLARYFTNELALTNRRVVAKTGLVSLHTTEIKLEKIESIEINQGLFGKMLNYGTVEITGTGGSHAVVSNIFQPVLFRKHFASATDDPPPHSQYGARAAATAG